MSPCQLTPERIEAVTQFHGHWCPGLAIGIRAAELALRELGNAAVDEELVAVVETDMCGVDGIQFLTGCTFGKGNFFHLDHGKMAFSFFRRSDGKGFRMLLLALEKKDPEAEELAKKRATVGLDEEDRKRLDEKRAERSKQIMEADLEALFDIQPPDRKMPVRARLMASLNCERCGESTMESRTRRFMGQALCIPCFESLEHRI